MSKKTKRKLTPDMQVSVDRMLAAIEKKHGPGTKVISGTVTDKDGVRHPLDVRGLEPHPERVDPDTVVLVDGPDGISHVHALPPPQVREAAHQDVGDTLRELTRLHADGDLTCVVGVGITKDGASFPFTSGIDIHDQMPDCLERLSKSVTDYSVGDSDDGDGLEQ